MKSEDIMWALGEIEDEYVAAAAPKALKKIRLSRKQLLVAAAVALCLLMAACAAVLNILNIQFPFSQKDKTQFNSVIYDIEPFEVTLQLPDGWHMSERKDTDSFNQNFALVGMWSVLDILDENNQAVGAMGYNIYEEYEGAQELPQAIYSQIALGNDYRFDVRNSYEVVKEHSYGKTAITEVYYSQSINSGNEKINKGILSYNKELLVYVAMEFDQSKITQQQLESAAESLEFVKK